MLRKLFWGVGLIVMAIILSPLPSVWAEDINVKEEVDMSQADLDQILESMKEQLIKISQEIDKILASRGQSKPKTSSDNSTSDKNSSSSQGSIVGGSSNSSSGSQFGAGAGSNQPFGGLSTDVFTCTCRKDPPRSLITLNPAKSDLPSQVIYEGTSSILYEYRMIKTPNQQLLGTVTNDVDCRIQVYAYCVTVATRPKIYMVGTSGGTSSGTGGQPEQPQEPSQPASSTPPTTPPDLCKRMGDKAYSYSARGTGYTKENTAMEGGPKDRIGNELITLQDYLAGKGSYVSVAMDTKTFPYGTELCIPEMEQKYGKQIVFRVVDTGSAFNGSDPDRWGGPKGTSRIDICTANQSAANDSTINGSLTLVSNVQSNR